VHLGFRHRDLRCLQYIYIYIIYTPNLGLAIAALALGREHGRFRGSSEGAPREQEEQREYQGSNGEYQGSKREQ